MGAPLRVGFATFIVSAAFSAVLGDSSLHLMHLTLIRMSPYQRVLKGASTGLEYTGALLHRTKRYSFTCIRSICNSYEIFSTAFTGAMSQLLSVAWLLELDAVKQSLTSKMLPFLTF